MNDALPMGPERVSSPGGTPLFRTLNDTKEKS